VYGDEHGIGCRVTLHFEIYIALATKGKCIVEWVEIIGFIVGVVGFVFALYQGTERRKLQNFLRSQNWQLYSKENNANGSLQRAIKVYESTHGSGVSCDVIKLLYAADAFSQDVFKDIVRQIQLAEKRFDHASIEEWVADGKVTEEHARLLFKPIVVTANKSSKRTREKPRVA